MKYLKLFENHEDKLFWEISNFEHLDAVYCREDDEWNKHEIERKWENFTPHQIHQLTELLGKSKKRSELNYKNVFSKEDAQRIFLSSDYRMKRDGIHVTRMEDEWYYIGLQGNFYYKCDQFDGLLACIEYLKRKGKI